MTGQTKMSIVSLVLTTLGGAISIAVGESMSKHQEAITRSEVSKELDRRERLKSFNKKEGGS